jgi:hypothetical protein
MPLCTTRSSSYTKPTRRYLARTIYVTNLQLDQGTITCERRSYDFRDEEDDGAERLSPAYVLECAGGIHDSWWSTVDLIIFLLPHDKRES